MQIKEVNNKLDQIRFVENIEYWTDTFNNLKKNPGIIDILIPGHHETCDADDENPYNDSFQRHSVSCLRCFLLTGITQGSHDDKAQFDGRLLATIE